MSDNPLHVQVKGKAGDYCRWRDKVKRTGTWVGQYDRNHPDNTVDGDHRWLVVCEDHGEMVTVPSTAAWNHAFYHPDDFCSGCRAILASKPVPVERNGAPKPAPAPAAPRQRKAVVNEEHAWQAWALKLADLAPKGTTVGWLGDFKYAVIFGDGPCYVVVKVSQYDADEATYTVEDCPAGNGQHPTLEAAIAAAQRKH